MKGNNNAVNTSQTVVKRSIYVRGSIIAWIIFLTHEFIYRLHTHSQEAE